MRSQALRVWQREALELYARSRPRDFLAVATPGAGKTTFALTLAAGLLSDGVVDRLVVVAPTEHLKTQWAHAASGAGIRLEPNLTGQLSSEFDGYVVTYAGLAANPTGHRVRIESRRTLVVLDEVHHAGDSLTWGESVREACEPATRRLLLTGTPFRSDSSQIPFVTYEPMPDGSLESRADYVYGYGPALRDGVVRPVLFMAYSGTMQWRTRAGDEMSARLGEPLTKDATAQALRTALDPTGSWVPTVLSAANSRLQEVRRGVPDAGGLVIAGNQELARQYAALLASVTGQEPTLVLSDDAGSSARIAEFAAGTSPWMVAVRMVSEGVDVPRLSVGVYATTAATPLYFAQAVGRFVRARRKGETASIFVPSVPAVLALAGDLEAERDHVIGMPVQDEADLLARAERTESTPDALEEYRALGSEASFDRVVYEGGEYGGYAGVDDDELDFLGIPGLLEPDQVADLLRASRTKRPRAKDQAATTDALFEKRSELRRELHALVAAWHHRTGEPHGVTHHRLRRECGGPPAAQATSAQLTERIDLLRQWALRASS